MRRSAFLGVFVLAFAMPAAGADGDVNADAFYRDARALVAKGMGAAFDKRTRPMMANMKAAALAAKVENEAGKKAGKPVYCVPAALRKKGLGPQDVVEKIGRLPESQRKSMTLKQAWRAAMIRDYPCG